MAKKIKFHFNTETLNYEPIIQLVAPIKTQVATFLGKFNPSEKTAIDFDRAPNNKPINIRERVVVTRVAEKKHNWLPIQVNFTRMFKDFPQNPGW